MRIHFTSPDFNIADLSDLSTHKEFTCIKHPGSLFTSKNPYQRSIFTIRSVGCDCDMDEIIIED